jgi:hypothetical protein
MLASHHSWLRIWSSDAARAGVAARAGMVVSAAVAAVMLAVRASRAPLGNRGDTAVTSPPDGP